MQKSLGTFGAGELRDLGAEVPRVDAEVSWDLWCRKPLRMLRISAPKG